MATFCTDAQVNAYLDQKKSPVQNSPWYATPDSGEAAEAENYIRASLAGHIDSATLAGWVNPGTTPTLVRTIQALFIAAAVYSKAYSEDSGDKVSPYALMLQTRAEALLKGVVTEQYKLWDISGNAVVISDRTLTEEMFFPNDTAVANDPCQAQMFTMGQRF